MKNYYSALLVTCLLFTPIVEAKEVKIKEVCAAAKSFAKTSMKIRQSNVPLSLALDQVDGMEEIVEHILLGAYEQPVHKNEVDKLMATIEYSSSVFEKCINLELL